MVKTMLPTLSADIRFVKVIAALTAALKQYIEEKKVHRIVA